MTRKAAERHVFPVSLMIAEVPTVGTGNVKSPLPPFPSLTSGLPDGCTGGVDRIWLARS